MVVYVSIFILIVCVVWSTHFYDVSSHVLLYQVYSSTTISPSSCRFSLLLLEFGEIYFEDYSTIYYPHASTESESIDRCVYVYACYSPSEHIRKIQPYCLEPTTYTFFSFYEEKLVHSHVHVIAVGPLTCVNHTYIIAGSREAD